MGGWEEGAMGVWWWRSLAGQEKAKQGREPGGLGQDGIDAMRCKRVRMREIA